MDETDDGRLAVEARVEMPRGPVKARPPVGGARGRGGRPALHLRRFALVAGLTLGLLLVGTVGYLSLPGWSAGDALYMTVITLSAVGYMEVHPLHGVGRALTTFLLAGGITTMGLWFALITSTLVELDLAQTFRKRRNMKRLERVRDHIVVCGAGRTGRQVIRELREADAPFALIERDPERAARLRELDPEAPVLEADATRDEALEQAGVRTARGLIACLSADTDNLFVCLSARQLNPDLTIVARAYDEETMTKLYRAGADHVVSPNITGGIRMASMLLRPQVMSFLDVVTRGEELSLRLEQVRMPVGSPLAGFSLAAVRIPQKTGLIVIAVEHPTAEGERRLVYNPGPDETLEAEDVLIVLGNEEQIERLRRTVEAPRRTGSDPES